MKLIHNTGTDRVIDLIRPHLQPSSQLDCVTPTLSLYAFSELLKSLWGLEKVKLVLPLGEEDLDFSDQSPNVACGCNLLGENQGEAPKFLSNDIPT